MMTAPAPLSLTERILDTFPSGSYALSALLRLMDIVESTSVPTAAVECRIQPRLLINPEFVAKHAPSSEKLMMLVMHELHHVLLGHTTLFPRVTQVQNFVFDAVINGIVCRMFPTAEHTSFFADFYDQKSFPECLLRLPPGWPGKTMVAGGIATLPAKQGKLVNEVHQALYSAAGATYAEVFDALPKLLVQFTIEGVPLIGGHQEGVDGGTADGQLEHQAPVLFDIVRSIVEQWPQPPDPIKGRSLADVLNQTTIRGTRSPSNRNLLRKLIRKVAGLKGPGAQRRRAIDMMEAPTPITLHWFPGDREARVLDIEVPAGQSVAADQLASCMDLSLLRSGEHFPVDNMVEVARWGHFAQTDYPWEQLGRI